MGKKIGQFFTILLSVITYIGIAYLILSMIASYIVANSLAVGVMLSVVAPACLIGLYCVGKDLVLDTADPDTGHCDRY